MPLDEREEVTGGSGVAPSNLNAGTYYFTLTDLQKRQMKRGQWADPTKGQDPEDLVTKIELHFKEDSSGDILTKLVGWSTVENSGLYKDVLPALNGGTAGIAAGSPVTGKLLNSLVGRRCMASVVKNPKGYAKIGNLIPVPGFVGAPLIDAPAGFAKPPQDDEPDGLDPNIVDPDFADDVGF